MTRFGSLLLFIAILLASAGYSQLTVNSAITPEQMVNDILLGAGVEAFNITYTGSPIQRGTFDSGNANVGIESGIIMSSGDIAGAIGPNTEMSLTTGNINGPGDPDLDDIANPGNEFFTTNDAAVLEFDFIPTGDTLKFQYVFASEEYMQYANGSINDAFAFILTGVSTVLDPVNIAVLPGLGIPVTLNNVNETNNSEFYIDNGDDDDFFEGIPEPFFSDPYYIQYDGLTVALTAVHPVICGEIYHIKIVIADGSDTILDSGVFLEEGSFSSPLVEVELAIIDIAENDTTIWEGCGNNELVFSRPESQILEQVFEIEITGTATNGVDVIQIPTEITFLENETEVSVPFVGIPDDIIEGPESITVTYTSLLECTGEFIEQSATFWIDEHQPLNVNILDEDIDCGDELTLSPEIEGGFGLYEVEWEIGENTLNLDISPGETTTYYFTVLDTCDIEPVPGEVTVTVPVYPLVEVDLGPDLEITCLDAVDIEPIVTGGNEVYEYQWTDSDNNVIGTDPVLNYQALGDGTVILTVFDACGNMGSDILDFSFPPEPVFVDLGPDFDVTCLDLTTVNPDVSGGIGSYSYQWYQQEFDIGTDPTIDVQLNVGGTFIVVVEDECGNIGTDELTISVPPVPIEVDLGVDLLVTCIDTSTLNPQVSGGVGLYSYSWTEEGLEFSTDPIVDVNTEILTEIILTIEDECGNIGIDAVILEIPDTPLSVITSNDSLICLGDSIHVWALASGGQGGYTYTWLPVFENGEVVDALPFQSTNYEVYVQDVCDNAVSASVQIIVEDLDANFDFDYVGDWGLEIYNTTNLDAVFFWDFDDGETSEEYEPTHTYYDLYPHTITLWAESENGCRDSISDIFYPFADIYIPTSFTPNGDGINDVFFAQGHEVREFEMWIFNRWGDLVFYTDEMDKPWVGDHDGNGDYFVQNEVYSWRLRAIGMRGRSIERFGTVTVLR